MSKPTNVQFTQALIELMKAGTCAPCVVEMLIDNGANVNAVVGDGQTPLLMYLASPNYDPDVARILIANGANVQAKDNWGNTPIFLAASRGLVNAAESLVQSGAKVNVENSRVPLIEAASNGHIEMVKYLLSCGADIHAVTSYSGATALHMAALYGQPEIAKLLLAGGANPESKDRDGATALVYSDRKGPETLDGSKEVGLILKALEEKR